MQEKLSFCHVLCGGADDVHDIAAKCVTARLCVLDSIHESLCRSTMSIVAILVLLAVAWSALAIGQIPNPFRARPSQVRLWRRAFPSASKRQIGEFLALFSDAFSFRATETQKFRPDDQLLGVYRALNPARWIPEAKEVERLAKELRNRYGVALADIWDERMTLGALFAHVQQKKQGTGHHGTA